jgi:hypothetical protein
MPQPLSTPPVGMPQEVIDFRTRTIMPEQDVDQLWSERPGYLEAAVAGALSDITARLRKRYRTPFTAVGGGNPRPEIVVVWQTKIVTPEAYRARGYNPQDPTMEWSEKDRDRAYEQIKEAADSELGLYDIPLLDTVDTSGVVKGGPLGSSQASPYDWIDEQAEALRCR